MALTSRMVILVDDDESFCLGLARLLSFAGHRVRTFTDPADFLAHLPADGPGCLLLDMEMPGLNGLEVQQAIAMLDRAWPTIFMTARGDIPTSVRAMKSGAIDVLTKPFEVDQLLKVIDQALSQDAVARAERAKRAEMERWLSTLTAREDQVFRLVVTGLMNKQIAAELGTTEKTIKVHRSRVIAKLGVQSLAELVWLAYSLDIHGPRPMGLASSG